jgi:hypothetical protein
VQRELLSSPTSGLLIGTPGPFPLAASNWRYGNISLRRPGTRVVTVPSRLAAALSLSVEKIQTFPAPVASLTRFLCLLGSDAAVGLYLPFFPFYLPCWMTPWPVLSTGRGQKMARRAASVGHRPVAEKDDGDVWLRSTDLSGGDSTGFCARLN